MGNKKASSRLTVVSDRVAWEVEIDAMSHGGGPVARENPTRLKVSGTATTVGGATTSVLTAMEGLLGRSDKLSSAPTEASDRGKVAPVPRADLKTAAGSAAKS
jgi:hypothetical protein